MADGGKRDPSSHRTPQQIKKMAAGYNHTPAQIKKRGQRNAARAEMTKRGLVHKGDGKDVDHVRPIRAGGGNGSQNLRAISKSRNRGWRDGVI